MMTAPRLQRPAVGELLDAALALYEQGFAVIPLGDPWTPPPVSVKGETEAERVRTWCKRPRVAWKQYQDKPADDSQIRQWWGQWPYANIAVLTGGYVGCTFRLVVVDADSQEADAFLETGITTTPVRTLTSRGRHRWYRMPKDLAITNAASAAKIDIRGEGGYVVAPGSTYACGTRNEWDVSPGWELDDFALLPELTAEDLGSIQRHGGRWSATNAEGDPQGEHEVLVDLGAIRAPHDGRPELPGGRNNALASQVGQWVQAGLSVDRLIRKAFAWNQSNPTPLPSSEVLTTITSIVVTHGRKHGVQPHSHTPGEQHGLEVLSFGELVDTPPAQPETWWHEGVLFRGARLLLAGPPKIGKSSLVIQLAIAAATGGELLGQRFEKPLRVLWVQAEIHKAFLLQRLERLTTGLDGLAMARLRDHFLMTGRCDLDLLDGPSYDLVNQMVGDAAPDLLIIDPIINFSSVDENDNAEMRKLLRLVDALGARHDCAVVLVHHTRKEATTSPFDAVRGASALRGWFDTGLMLSGEAAQPVIAYECRNAVALPTMVLDKTAQGRFIPCTLTHEDSESADPTIRGVMPGNTDPNAPQTIKPTKTYIAEQETIYHIVTKKQPIGMASLTDDATKLCQINRTEAGMIIGLLVQNGRIVATRGDRMTVYRTAEPLGAPIDSS